MHSIKEKYLNHRTLYVIGGLLGLSIIIIAHECGHFICAHLFGVSTPTFSIGFGPALLQIPVGDTLFQIAAIPLGGYVEMNQEELAALSYVPKMIIILAGIVVNFLFAYITFTYFLMRTQYHTTPVIETIAPDSPADHAGLQPNDTIIAIDHTLIFNNGDTLLNALTTFLDKPLPITIERDGTTTDIMITPIEHPLLGTSMGWIGIQLQKIPNEHLPFLKTLRTTHKKLVPTIVAIGNTAASLIRSSKNQHNAFIGPIGIISMISRSLAVSQEFFWLVLALISLNIGIFNLLPLPIFDGGKACIITLEALTGQTISESALWVIMLIFIILMLFSVSQATLRKHKK